MVREIYLKGSLRPSFATFGRIVSRALYNYDVTVSQIFDAGRYVRFATIDKKHTRNNVSKALLNRLLVDEIRRAKYHTYHRNERVGCPRKYA